MNTHAIFPALILAAAAVYAGQAAAVVPPVETAGVAAAAVCPATLALPTPYYSDKIVFEITGQLVAAVATDQPSLSKLRLNTELDIKVRDNPRAVADIRGKVLSFLGAADAGTENRLFIKIISVEYTAILCPKAP